MGAAPADREELQGSAAREAWFALAAPAVDAQVRQIVPGFSVRVGERRERGALTDDCLREDGLDRRVQPTCLGSGETAGGPEWMNAGPEQGFVDINIAEASESALVKERGLDWRCAACQPF